jgi:hypothetical protein
LGSPIALKANDTAEAGQVIRYSMIGLREPNQSVLYRD